MIEIDHSLNVPIIETKLFPHLDKMWNIFPRIIYTNGCGAMFICFNPPINTLLQWIQPFKLLIVLWYDKILPYFGIHYVTQMKHTFISIF